MRRPSSKAILSCHPGGVIVGYEMGRQLGVPSLFCERENGVFTFRRGFSIPKDAKILVVEDVVTTAKSLLETIDCIRAQGGNVLADLQGTTAVKPGSRGLTTY